MTDLPIPEDRLSAVLRRYSIRPIEARANRCHCSIRFLHRIDPGTSLRAIACAVDAGAMVTDYYLEDFVPGHVYSSPTHTVSDEEALDFARRYDPQYFHLDPVAAQESVFGGLVLGGFQVAALAWAMVLRTGMFDQCAMAGIGLDEVRWRKPVRPRDRLRCEFTLLDARASKSHPDGGVARFCYEMKNQQEEIVLSLIMIQLLRSRR